MNPLLRLRRLLIEDKKDIYQVYVYALFNGLVNLSLPVGIQSIINIIQGGEISTSWIVLVSLVLFGVAASGFLQLMQLRIVENIAQKIFTRASFEFAYRIPKIKFSELYKYYAPELANRFFDVITIQKGLPKILIDFTLSSFQIVVGLVLLGFYHPFFILFGIVLVALIYTIFVFTGPAGLRTSLDESKYKYSIAHWIEEVARAKLSFKLIGEDNATLNETDTRVTKYLGSRESHFRVLVRQFLQLTFFKIFVSAGLLIIGGLLVFKQEMNIGQFVAAELLILIIFSSIEKLISSLDSIYDVLTALEKIGYVTDMQLDQEGSIDLNETSADLSISLNNVSFRFPDSESDLLKDISFDLTKSQHLIISGAAGAGKSTLVQLISGIYNPTTGTIAINGMPLSSVNSSSIRKKMGFVLSNNQIFQGTILDNIKMGRNEITLHEIIQAIDKFKLSEFISSLPDGLLTNLDPEGRRIPKSVVSKIILVRSIIHRPKILILEDPLEQYHPVEKELILKALLDQSNPWKVIVSSNDPLWKKYIKNELVIENGIAVNHTQK